MGQKGFEVETGVEKRIGNKTKLSGGMKVALDQDTAELGYDEENLREVRVYDVVEEAEHAAQLRREQ